MVKRWENIERADFLGVGEYDIPTIEPVEFSGNTKFIPFNYAASCKKREDKSIHCIFHLSSASFPEIQST